MMAKMVQITSVINGKLRIDRNALLSILLRSDIKDNNIAIVSICSDGKAEALNVNLLQQCLKNYNTKKQLHINEARYENGLASTISDPLPGIRIWDEIVMIDIDKDKRIGILIIESTGNWVGETTNSVKLLTWTLLGCSIQIINISQKLERKITDELKCALDYAMAISAKKATDMKLRSVMFLVQNWVDTNKHYYGSNGGMEYLKNATPTEGLLENIKKCSTCSEVECFLLPNRQVSGMPHNFFNNNSVAAEGASFNRYMSAFGDILLNRISSLKDVNTSMQIFELLMFCDEIWSSAVLPEPEVILEEASASHYGKACDRCFAKYDQEMKMKTKAVQYDDLEEVNGEVTMKILKEFDSTTEIGPTSVRSDFRDKLSSKCRNRFRQYQEAANELKRDAEKELKQITEREMSVYLSEIEKKLTATAMSDADLEKSHNLCYEKAIKEFDSKTSTAIYDRCEKLKNKYKEKIKSDIEKHYDVVKNKHIQKRNELQLEKLVNQMSSQYQRRIRDFSSKGIEEKSLQVEHNNISRLIVLQFLKDAFFAPNILVNAKKGMLDDRIRTIYLEALNQNRNVLRQKLEALVNSLETIYQQKINEIASKGVDENALQSENSKISTWILSQYSVKTGIIDSEEMVKTHKEKLINRMKETYNAANIKNKQVATERNQLEQRLRELVLHERRPEPTLEATVVQQTVQSVQRDGDGIRVIRSVRTVILPNNRGGR